MYTPPNPTFPYIKWVFSGCSLHGLVNIVLNAVFLASSSALCMSLLFVFLLVQRPSVRLMLAYNSCSLCL